jgi:phage FluMu gp28-like protein
MGIKIYDPQSRREITPDQARALALDKLSYDQNYECAFNDENMALLTHALITACEYPGPPIPGPPNSSLASSPAPSNSSPECHINSQDWPPDTLDFLRACKGPLGVGLDVGRSRDITVVTVAEKIGGVLFIRAILRLTAMRLPQQLDRLRPILHMPNFGRLSGDATGIGLGLIEFAQEESGPHRVEAVQFSAREKRIVRGIRQADSALVTELMALDLLELFEDRSIRIPCENALRESLRKPQRVTTAGGVRIAATRDESGHADEFWSMALVARSLKTPAAELTVEALPGFRPHFNRHSPLAW